MSKLDVKLDYFSFNTPYQYISSEYEQYLLKPTINALLLNNENCDTKARYSEHQAFTRIFKKYSDSTNIIINDSVRENAFLEKEYLTRVELKGRGCREFEERGGNWKDLTNYVISSNSYLTTLDIAVDDKEGYMTIEQLDKYIRNNWFKSEFKVYKEDSTYNAKIKDKKGWGYFFGSRNSNVQLRIYDKRLEQLSKGVPIDVDCKHWVRYELRFMHEKAKSIIYELRNNIDNLNVWGAQILKGYLTFLSPNKQDSNKSRWKTFKPWENMLANLEKTKVKTIDEYKNNGNYASMVKWLENACSRSLMINELVNDEEENKRMKLGLKLIGLLKITNVDLNIINKERSFMQPLSMSDIQRLIKKTHDELSKCCTPLYFRNFKEKIEKMFGTTYEYLVNACKVV